ncbi:MAG: hypothetical protein EOO07_02570 [Chitinophagaceae bacterium]|nr:MAG: hypothetical protein EOO07_02570 [Chitinophagaceae bacterium]
MKKLIFPALVAIVLLSSFGNKIINDLEKFYSHLGRNIKYPSTASGVNLQGNTQILFAINDGKLNGLKIEKELGGNCDIEVVNQILAFNDYKSLKNGKYALKVTFKLDGSKSELKNLNLETPTDYTPMEIVIVGYAPNK